MRDILVTSVIVSLLPLCFVKPWVGALVWTWIGLMNPHKLAWGFARTMPFALMVAAATLAGALLTRDRRPIPRTAEVYLLLAMWGVFLLSTLTAINPTEAWPQLDRVSKIFLMTLVSMKLLQEPRKVRALLWVMGLSIGFYGLKGGIWAVRTGGQNMVVGPEGSFIAGNTEIGLALNMAIPILIFLRREETRRWVRHFLSATILFSVVAVLITYSRGAFLGLGAVLVMLILKGRKKLLLLPSAALAVVLAATYLPAGWFERMETIQTYERDSSAVSRLKTWKVGYWIALDRPLLGAGFRPFTRETFDRYMPNYPKDHDAHNIFIQVLAEHGFTGLALYGGLLVATGWNLRRLIRRARGDPSLRWVYNCCHMLEVSLVGYVVSGIFLSLSYFDFFYSIVAVSCILQALVARRERGRASVAGDATSQGGLEQIGAARVR